MCITSFWKFQGHYNEEFNTLVHTMKGQANQYNTIATNINHIKHIAINVFFPQIIAKSLTFQKQ